jgi:hypothetical protein
MPGQKRILDPSLERLVGDLQRRVGILERQRIPPEVTPETPADWILATCSDPQQTIDISVEPYGAVRFDTWHSSNTDVLGNTAPAHDPDLPEAILGQICAYEFGVYLVFGSCQWEMLAGDAVFGHELILSLGGIGNAFYLPAEVGGSTMASGERAPYESSGEIAPGILGPMSTKNVQAFALTAIPTEFTFTVTFLGTVDGGASNTRDIHFPLFGAIRLGVPSGPPTLTGP